MKNANTPSTIEHPLARMPQAASASPEAKAQAKLYDPPPGFFPAGMFWNGMCWQRIETEHQQPETQMTRGPR